MSIWATTKYSLALQLQPVKCVTQQKIPTRISFIIAPAKVFSQTTNMMWNLRISFYDQIVILLFFSIHECYQIYQNYLLFEIVRV